MLHKEENMPHTPSTGNDMTWHDMHPPEETATHLRCPAVRLSWPDRGRWLWLPCSWGWCRHGLGTPPRPPPTGRKTPCCRDDTRRNLPASLTLRGTSARPGCCRLKTGSEVKRFKAQNITKIKLCELISAARVCQVDSWRVEAGHDLNLKPDLVGDCVNWSTECEASFLNCGILFLTICMSTPTVTGSASQLRWLNMKLKTSLSHEKMDPPSYRAVTSCTDFIDDSV